MGYNIQLFLPQYNKVKVNGGTRSDEMFAENQTEGSMLMFIII